MTTSSDPTETAVIGSQLPSARLHQELDAWRKLAIARGRILVGYRTGKTPAKGIDDAVAAELALRKLGVDSATGKAI